MYSAKKLNKQGDTIQPWQIPFPIWNQSVVLYAVLTLPSWPAYIFLRRQVRWLLFPSLEEFSKVGSDPHSQKLWYSNKSEVDVFSGILLLFLWSSYVGNLISGSSVFSKFSLNIWKFTIHILLKPSLENFEHYFASMLDKYSHVVDCTFFGIALFLDWNENWPFPVL